MDEDKATDANPDGGTPADDTTAKLTTLTAENESLKRTQSSLQRELERIRQSGGNIKGLEARLQANEDAQIVLLEAVGAIAAAKDEAELKGVSAKIANTVEQVRKQRTTPPPETKADPAVKAGSEIVSAAELAGITEDKFEEAWKADPRFVEARALWRAGSHDAAVVAFKTAVSKPALKTEDEIKKRVEEELAKARRQAAPTSSSTSSTTGNDRAIKASDIAKMPASERNKYGKDLRAALERG